ncbi:hypothetical protein OKW45_004877 [Paraburkholderia sp. WSM4175]|uniref:hypothetical protein n=1 Tax=Paraburkholderia sp. WSM4175 TaxID=2991072 RepID=UPI003D24BC15
MLKQSVGSAIFALALISSLAFSAPTSALSFSTKDDILSIFRDGKNLGQFSNVVVSNAAMSSSVEKSTTGEPLIKIVTDGSRDKYDITIPIIEREGVPFTDCAYKSVFDSNDGNRSVGVSCSLAPLRQFDPEATVNEEHLLKYRTGLDWLRNVVAKDCAAPQGIEYGSYRIALCAKQAYPDPAQETTIVFNEKAQKLFSVRGYELIPGGISRGEFAFVGASGESTTLYVSSLDCMLSPIPSEKASSKTGTIGKYRIRYSAQKFGDCAYGSYAYENKASEIRLFGSASKDTVHLLEMTGNKDVTGLFDLDPNIEHFNGNWISVPPGKLFLVK